MEPSASEPGVDEKIVAAIERLARASRAMLQDAVKRRGLSPIQAQILTYLDTHDPRGARVGYLAREFNLTPATVSDSVSSLEAKGLLRREPTAGDARMSTLRLTGAGRALARELADWTAPLRDAVAATDSADRERALAFLMRLIERLQHQGVISVARMCLTCRFFLRDAHHGSRAPHHCALLDRPLAISALRVDCPDYQAAPAAAGG